MTYVVTSDRLSRKPGETFSDDELSAATIATLISGGHLIAAPENPTDDGHAADEQKES